MASGLLGDTLSYIRLFAIGLTGAILGGVFNQLAVDMTEGMNIVLRAVCMLLILLVGHAINIGLCTISSLVHPSASYLSSNIIRMPSSKAEEKNTSRSRKHRNKRGSVYPLIKVN